MTQSGLSGYCLAPRVQTPVYVPGQVKKNGQSSGGVKVVIHGFQEFFPVWGRVNSFVSTMTVPTQGVA